ncbi:ABC-ATPase domain-containing protein [Candidatus Aminicenantes bacterium AC-335-B20]|jgi:predicted ABC-class ATPase|nr:ABC-ATPase domain-containing protein [SCandidatus Aminicenantes bacterium Aminicenantia_JdfR_composite]MCP2596346.1 ABC-ATPase domain-containing protein [Candidatus Aminicenantes bacterium AC-335-G13]MCP2599014.1 ABC-ATPase domain-containing protein [Candidatus Aminicenantes bacterium AC-335-B20]MCP2605413.1 ABC-ATPase domain-containing protein [Candidatus Aminicenantes bacterium AC-335-O07]MCP2605977.1 ABC-ATPase domain-containing protein [Candidatus Aminicenantes bacterium AC-708-I09]MCP2
MKSAKELKEILINIDGKGYKAYKRIEGIYRFDNYRISIDHVQGDPFASPTKVRVFVDEKIANFPKDTYSNKSREIALRDFLTRKFSIAIKKYSKGKRGSGKSGLIGIDIPGQEILERNSILINKGSIEVRFTVGLPARGRRILSKIAFSIFFEEIPRIVIESLFYKNLDKKELYRHIEISEDADYLRSILDELGLVAFIGENSILPRRSGIDPRPLSAEKAIRFRAPEELKFEVKLPNKGLIKGMGIPKGVTLIVGGGYHGKSTLLEAIQFGIYNHIPGDGREYVVSNPDTVKIRAENGRRIEKVDISNFISKLPLGKDTRVFSTDNASGSTSQAANIIEALEMGAKVLLIDEDTSATNFMIRDHKMQELISKDKEPITPFIDKVQQLYKDYGVSSIIVIGGAGDYLDVADCVISMVNYVPFDFTQKAKQIVERFRTERKREGGIHFGRITKRIPSSCSIKRWRKIKIDPYEYKIISCNGNKLDLTALEQLVHPAQTKAIARALSYSIKYMDGKRTLREIVERVIEDVEKNGLDILSRRITGDFAKFRKYELAFALNRLKSFEIKQML